jgi:hypothetical protein
MFKKFISIVTLPKLVPIGLFLVTFLAYGVLSPQLGFYWDDQGMSWIRYQFGTDAMRLYFSTSRPVWGELFQITTRLLPHIPVYWQLFAVFWRWVTAVLCWAVFRELWPNRERLGLTISLFFLLYPGFNLQWVSYLSSHFFIVLSFYLFSYLLMLWSFRHRKWFWPFTFLALLFSALNLWMLEYFFFLELIRPFVIIAFLKQDSSLQRLSNRRHLPVQTFLKWLPYLVIWLVDVFYRTFIFSNLAYKNTLLNDLSSRPLSAGLTLIRTVFSDLWLVSVKAWIQIFQFPSFTSGGLLTVLFYAGIVVTTGLIIILLLGRTHPDEMQSMLVRASWPVGLGFVTMLVAGGPYWLAKLDITLGFPASRFTVSFILGVSILLAGLLELFPVRLRLVFVVILVALAGGRQALWADSFRRDWNTQKAMFWQMNWRAPGLVPNTTVLMNQGPLNYYADNSLAAALNWIYDPDNRSNNIHYVLFFPTSRLDTGSVPGFEPGLSINYNYLIGKFSGNTSQTVVFYYEPPGCLRLMDPVIDSENRLIHDSTLLRDAAKLSSAAWILADPKARMPEIYDPEPVHGWCYYFEKADLARQVGNWERVVKLGDKAFSLSDYPNDPVERFVFVEGYAHSGNWERAKELAVQSYKVSPNYVGPLLCKLLDRIDNELPASDVKESSLNDLRTKFSCLP